MVATSFGEVDWVLPVARAFMEKHKNWRLITLFGHAVVFEKFKLANKKLFDEFMKVSSLNIVPQEINGLFSNIINPNQVKLILKDYNRDEFAPMKKEIATLCPGAMLVSYPHSCHIYSRAGSDPVYTCKNPDEISKHDLFLLDSENDIPQWSKTVDLKKIRTLGYPRYDSWWRDRFLKDPVMELTIEFQKAQKADKVFFNISRSAHPHYLSQSDYEYLLKSTAEVVFSYDNSLLMLKPHPRQDISELFELLKPYDKNRYLVSGLHLMQLSHMSDVVISGWSSGILDALAVKKPVIEFWRFGGRDPLCRKDEKGNYTTIYRELGLAAPADTKKELEALVQSALYQGDGPIWQSQIDAFNIHCKFTDQAAHGIVSLLDTELNQRAITTSRKRQIKSTPQTTEDRPDELIDNLIEYITTLVEEDQQVEAEKWLQFLNSRFPGDVKIQNNYSILLFNQEKANEAVDMLVDCLNQHPSNVETVMNLIQILLLLERPDDALGMVVSFYTQAPEPIRASFLKALSEQLTTNQFAVVYSRIKERHQQQ